MWESEMELWVVLGEGAFYNGVGEKAAFKDVAEKINPMERYDFSF